MLADPAALEAVALGPDGVLANADGGTLVDMSTISPDVSARSRPRPSGTASPSCAHR